MNPAEKRQRAGRKSRKPQERPSKHGSEGLRPNIDPTFGRESRTLRPGPLDLFAELQPAEQDAFLARCTRLHFSSGSNIFSQGEPYTSSHLIRAGVVRTYYLAPSGKEITIAYWPQGILVGGPNVFKERRVHIWSAQAATDVVTEQIRGQDLEELSMQIPHLAHYLIETLTFKLHWVSVLLQTFGTQSCRARVAHLLLQLGERYGVERPQGTLIAQHFSHEELGRMVGATRSWVTLALKQLKKEGIIATRGREIFILSMDDLRGTTQGATPTS
jgi:CRP/FNR family transcriptional regulator, cyclic AMP receptor protein